MTNPEKQPYQQAGEEVAREFIPIFDEMTTSDLQGCVGAAVSQYNLSALDAFEAENLALELIYQKQEQTADETLEHAMDYLQEAATVDGHAVEILADAQIEVLDGTSTDPEIAAERDADPDEIRARIIDVLSKRNWVSGDDDTYLSPFDNLVVIITEENWKLRYHGGGETIATGENERELMDALDRQ